MNLRDVKIEVESQNSEPGPYDIEIYFAGRDGFSDEGLRFATVKGGEFEYMGDKHDAVVKAYGVDDIRDCDGWTCRLFDARFVDVSLTYHYDTRQYFSAYMTDLNAFVDPSISPDDYFADGNHFVPPVVWQKHSVYQGGAGLVVPVTIELTRRA